MKRQYRIRIEKDGNGEIVEVDVQRRGWHTLWFWETMPKWQYCPIRGYKINLCRTVEDAKELIAYCKMRDAGRTEYQN